MESRIFVNFNAEKSEWCLISILRTLVFFLNICWESLFSKYKYTKIISSNDLPCFLHYWCIATIASATSLWSKHVKIVAKMIRHLKALGAKGHTGWDPTSAASIGDEVSSPNETASWSIVVSSHWKTRERIFLIIYLDCIYIVRERA